MTREQHLQFCNSCTNRKMDLQQGMICNITDRKADFENTCPEFEQDTSITSSRNVGVSQEVNLYQLSEEQTARLHAEENLTLGLVGGAVAGLIGAGIWAMVTVGTGYQIGFMAIGIGYIVGMAIRYLGKGIRPIFGYFGAVIAILSCLLGNIFGALGFVAQYAEIPFLEVLFYFDYTQLIPLLAETFSVMDVLFYGIAGFEGYKFAFRLVEINDLDD